MPRDEQVSPAASTPAPSGPAASTPASPGPAASGSPAAPAGRPTPLSATRPPIPRRPAGPPKKPTDARPAGVVAGWITRGGTGPCYGLVDENGREYALHGPDAGELREGAFVSLRLAPGDSAVDCGPGVPMRIVTD
ncbi:hypothetical protein [Micromonospora robiginosa]|uniref:Uncharacterized protein n=1 Tax=Micromonospora robiginosa TaxID=2749844 RepID=A0AAF0T0I7_9ACTN|nr:hypothetical protein [Micromonospora ferruginea]WMF04602.1 hypothetical protein H1D33_08910 [Micromonospora ferruginea]